MKCRWQVLQLMIKVSVFNKINNNLIVDTFKNVFQRGSSEVFQPDVPECRTIQKYMLHCQYSIALCTSRNIYVGAGQLEVQCLLRNQRKDKLSIYARPCYCLMMYYMRRTVRPSDCPRRRVRVFDTPTRMRWPPVRGWRVHADHSFCLSSLWLVSERYRRAI